jgi:hypothetical protein
MLFNFFVGQQDAAKTLEYMILNQIEPTLSTWTE